MSFSKITKIGGFKVFLYEWEVEPKGWELLFKERLSLFQSHFNLI